MKKNSYYENLPTKRVAAGVIFFDKNENILIVKPTYKDHWSIPGGVIEKNESPHETCVREIKEELDIEIKNIKFLTIDYMSAEKSEYKNKTENLQFIFHGGTLQAQKIRNIHLPKNELSEYKFVSPTTAYSLLNKNLAKRLPKALSAFKQKTAFYLEGGKIL